MQRQKQGSDVIACHAVHYMQVTKTGFSDAQLTELPNFRFTPISVLLFR